MQRALQVRRIKEIGDALVLAGVSSLDDQACALGLCRSTAWSLLKASHKNSGLSASVVNAILKSPKLPPEVRSKVLEYVEEKISGCYGHRSRQISRFAARLALSKQIARSRSMGFDTTQLPKTAANSPIRPTFSLTLPRPANSLAPAPPIALSPSVTGDATAMPSILSSRS